MRFPPSFLDEIRSRIPISDVVGRRVTWDKRKSQPQRGDYWACCPFHGEKTPSFHADNRRGMYHCFGCGVSGDHFGFLVEGEGMPFPEAVSLLAGEAGLALPAMDKQSVEKEKKRRSLQDVMELAAEYFVDCLKEPVGQAARDYLAGRGLSPELIERFRIGYAPSSRGQIKDHLVSKGVDQQDLIDTGLLISGDDIPVSYARFRDRIMFPIEDVRGKAIAFGGRAMSSDQRAKYLNSPETNLFHKGQVLFNARAARSSARRSEPLIVVEGYMDVIACVGAGFEAVVAPLGTALTADQMGLLWQMTDEPVLCFDGDEAGAKAAFRAVDMAMPMIKPGKSLSFAILPEGSDPDDVIRTGGPEAFKAKIGSAVPLVDMVWRRHTAGQNFTTPERRAGLERDLRAAVSEITDTSVKRHYEISVRERINSAFAGVSGPQDRSSSRRRSDQGGFRGNGGYGKSANGRARDDRFSGNNRRNEERPSHSLLSTAIVRRGVEPVASDSGRPSLQDAVLLGGFLYRPELAEDRFETFSSIEFGIRKLQVLASRLASLIAEDPDIASTKLINALKREGFGGQIEEIGEKISSCGLAEFGPDGDIDQLGALWDDAAHLRRRSETLSNKRLAIADALGRETDEADIARLREMHRQDENKAQKSAEESGPELKVTHPFKSQ